MLSAARPSRRAVASSGGGVSAVLVTALLAGCTGTTPGTAGAAPPPKSGLHHHGSAPTALPTERSFFSRCEARGPLSGPAALRAVELVVHQRDLIVAFSLDRAVRGEVLVSLRTGTGAVPGPAASDGGFTMTARVHDQTPVALTITTAAGTASSEKVETALHVVDDEVHVRLPSLILAPLGPRWHWSAAATATSDTARCPSGDANGGGEVVQVSTP